MGTRNIHVVITPFLKSGGAWEGCGEPWPAPEQGHDVVSGLEVGRQEGQGRLVWQCRGGGQGLSGRRDRGGGGAGEAQNKPGSAVTQAGVAVGL